ncbi:MAG TPA: hypothetical protein VL832_04175 [Puia sp.]|nr:hypothetical protein [Puia sp.]
MEVLCGYNPKPVKSNVHFTASMVLLLVGCCYKPSLYGQSPVTSFSAAYVSAASPISSYTALPASPGTFSGCSSTSYLYTFSNGISNQLKLNSFNANGNSYFIAPASAATVKLRRVNNSNATGSRNIVYMESTAASASACPGSGALNFKPPYLDVVETVLGAGMLNQGTDNLFTNAGNGDGNNNNIERVDIIFASRLNTSSPTEAGFAIFDRGNNFQHDPFKIVAITSLDANGDPASFGTVKTCAGGNGSNNNGNWGHPSTLNGNLQLSAYVLRKDEAELRLRVSSNVNQEVGGVFYTFADLGITAGQFLYGYALLAADGTVAPSSAQLLTLSNTSVYPTNTSEAQGGLDLVAVNTVFATGSYVVLPVRITSFTSSMQDDGGHLEWELGNVTEDQRVSLEKSADGTAYSNIWSDRVSMAGASLPGEYIDKFIMGAGIYYYRLKITDASGSVQYSQTLTLHGNGPGKGWKIYPTMIAPRQQLKLQGITDGYYTAIFYDMGGSYRKVAFRVLNREAWIDQPPGGLLPGIYWLRITGNGQALTGGTKIFISGW